MSYSRWGSKGSGHWYTFWSIHSPKEKETRNNAIFEICCVATFTAKDLRDDIDECIKTVAIKDKTATKEKLKELRTYMDQFLQDVDEEYPPYNSIF